MVKTLIVLFCLCLCADALAVTDKSVGKKVNPTVSLLVISDHSEIQTKIKSAVEAELKKHSITLVETREMAFSSLLLLAARTIENKNPDQIAVAIAHVSSVLPRLMNLEAKKIKDSSVASSLDKLIEEAYTNQPLNHLNVAVLDDLSPKRLDIFSKAIVTKFLEKEFGMK